MRLLFISLLLLGRFSACCDPVLASWASVSEETLIDQAELIIEGIVARTEPGFNLGGRDYQFVVIDVSDVLKGAAGEEVRIVQPALSLLAISTDLRFDVGQQGAWLLSQNPLLQNEYSIKHPSQYQPGGIVVKSPSISIPPSDEVGTVPEPSSLVLATVALWSLRMLSSRWSTGRRAG